MSTYEENRMQFSVETLKPYAGQWVAFGMDGRRILASAATLRELEERLAAGGLDPQQAAFEYIEFQESLAGGTELH
jgi:hypothetical protein